jgi:two-component system sensor histidine kinase KdpD
VIRVDARAVAEVIYTLLDNASKYGPPDTCITIKANRAPGEMVKISVADEGPGIPQHLRKRVFDKFVHVGGAPIGSGRPEGIGMGLSIAKGIVEAHGGLIWVDDNENGKGAEVSFTVPVGDDDGETGSRRVVELMEHDGE